MKSILTRRVDGILGGELTTLLRERGFRKQGRLYVAESDTVTRLVEAQLSRWSDEDEARFSINGGVFVPGVVSAYSGREETINPKLLDCCLSVRIGMLDSTPSDKWWKITASDATPCATDEQIGADIRNHMESTLLPFLARFESPSAVAAFLARPIEDATKYVFPRSAAQRHSYASLIYSLLGDTERARKEIDFAVHEAKGSPIEEIIEKLRRHIVVTLPK